MNRIIFSSVLLLFTGLFFNFSNISGIKTINDSRDGQVYKTVEIDQQVWFAENLNFKTPKSVCYKKQKKNCEKHGRLYPFDELKMACPIGWRVPNIEDWKRLKNNFSDNPILDLLDKNGWKNSEKHRNNSGLSLQGAGYQFKRRLFIGEAKATTLWIDEMNDFGEFFHAHLYGGDGTYFEATDYRTNEVFHAHPIENLEHRRFSIRCVCDKKDLE